MQHLSGEDEIGISADDIAIRAMDLRPVPCDSSGVGGLQDFFGDVPERVLILLMTSGLVVSIWAVARDQLVSIVSTALSTVCGSVGC